MNDAQPAPVEKQPQHPHAELLQAAVAARKELDAAVERAQREITQVENQWAEYEKFLDEQDEEFANRRNRLNHHPKLGWHARRFDEFEKPAQPMIDLQELKKSVQELGQRETQHVIRGNTAWFKRRHVAAAMGCLEEARAELRYARDHGEQPFNEREQKALTELKEARARLQPALDAWRDARGQASPDWSSTGWEEWSPPSEIPYAISFGRSATRQSPIGTIDFAPAWPVNDGRSLLLWNHGSGVIEQVQSLILRILAQFPPGMARFTFIDPLGAGQSVAPFLHLSDYDEGLVGGKVWSESAHVEQRLSELQAHIEMVVQKYLRGQFPDIESHNAAAGEIAEAYRFLVIFDFPANFTETSARRLVSIARNGPACGVYAIIVAAPGREMPHGFNGTELDGPTQIFSQASANGPLVQVLGRDNFSPWQVGIEAPPSLTLTDPGEPQNLFSRVISGIGSKARAATNVEVSQQRLLELLESTLAAGLTEHQPVVESCPQLEDRETWWTGDASVGIAAPIGRVGARAVQSLALVGTDTSVHALIAGKTGSGKSTLLHAAILNLCLIYSPEELELYLVDFKQGVEFKPYALQALPHARVVAIESEREFGLSVLRGLESEISSRGEKFRAAGVDDLADYRRTTGESMPRILLVADEFHVLFSDDDSLANEAARILDRLVRQGRSFGVHVILASQTISGVHQVGRGTMNQIAVRIALQCSESDSQVIFGEDNVDARLLNRPGEAIYNSMNGMPEGNRRFQVVLLQDEERERILVELRKLAEARGFDRQPVVFEGNAQADLTANEPLKKLLDGEDSADSGRAAKAWLGEPISLEGPVKYVLDRRAGANLIVVGSDGAVADGLLAGSLVALLPQVEEQGAIEAIDFGGLDEPFAACLDQLAAASAGRLQLGRRRQFPTALERLAEELRQRMDGPSMPMPTRVLLLHRLQSARELDASNVSFGEDSPDLGRLLTEILRDGPEFGIHTIASCDTLANLERRLDPSAQREFGLRVASRMSENDSLQLIDNPDAAKLVGAQAIFLDDDRSQQLKLRAYEMPSSGWLEELAGRAGWQPREGVGDLSTTAGEDR